MMPQELVTKVEPETKDDGDKKIYSDLVADTAVQHITCRSVFLDKCILTLG